MAKSVEQMLGEMEDAWQRGKEGPIVPPDGEYMMQLVSADIRPTKDGTKLICFRQHTIIEGEYANATVRDFVSLQENQMYRMNQWIEQMGYESPESPKDIPAILEAIIAENPTYTANLRSSGDFTNITDFEVVQTEDGDEAEAVEDGGESEEEVEEVAEEEGGYEDDEHAQLYGICAACGAEIVDGLDKAALIAEMKNFEWEYSDFVDDPDGLALMKKLSMDIIGAPAVKPALAKKGPAAAVKPAGAKTVAATTVGKKPGVVGRPAAKPAPAPAAKGKPGLIRRK